MTYKAKADVCSEIRIKHSTPSEQHVEFWLLNHYATQGPIIIIIIIIYLLIYSMEQSPHKKLTGSQLVKKFPAFYGTRKFITAFTSARHLSLSWASSIHSIPS